MTEDGTGRVQLRCQPFANAEKLRDVVADTYRQLKQRHVDIQRKMSLYLANKDTEFILFKPMKVNLLYFIYLSVTDGSGYMHLRVDLYMFRMLALFQSFFIKFFLVFYFTNFFH